VARLTKEAGSWPMRRNSSRIDPIAEELADLADWLGVGRLSCRPSRYLIT
jgi:hypothetical protein